MIGRGALRAAGIALYAMLAGVVAPSLVWAQDVVCDPGELEVRSLQFRGNEALKDSELALSVATTPSSLARRTLRIGLGPKRCLDRDALPRDVLSLISYYRERGFYQVRVDTTVQPYGRDAVRVIFTIEEGSPTLVRTYDVEGLSGVPDSAHLVNDLRLRVGERFDFSLLQADVDSLRRRLRDAGYYHVDILAPAYDRDSLVASVTLTVIPGPRAVFGEPEIDVTPLAEHSQQLATPVARRVMGIVPGSPYSDRAVIAAQRALFQLGTYRHVDVTVPDSLQPAGDSVVVLLVRLTEGYMRQLDSEFGWATLDCGRVRMVYTDRNWLGTARRLDLTGQASKIGYGDPLASDFTRRLCDFNGRSPLAEDATFSSKLHYYGGAAVRSPRLLGTQWVPTLSLYSERRGEYRAYLRTTYGGLDFSGVRDVKPRTPFRLGYSVEYGFTEADNAALCALFNRCTPEQQRDVTEEATLGVASASIARIRTDNPIAPNRGSIMRAELRSSATKWLGTSPNLFFNKATGDVSVFLPFGWRNVLALRMRVGIVEGIGGNRGFVPTQERLYAGGAGSVRGFQQNELGSLVYISAGRGIDSIPSSDSTFWIRASDSPDSLPGVDRIVPLGGNTLVVANIDYRIRDPFFLPDVLQYSFFVDVGEVWTRSAGGQGFGFDRLKWTPGVGVRAFTPIGPVQVNVGYNNYPRVAGPLYFNPNVRSLYCATPGNTIDLRRDPVSLELVQVDPNAVCPGGFRPPRPTGFFQKLTFTFSIGSEF